MLVLYAAIAGGLLALLPAELWFFPAIPIFVISGLILWSLPDLDKIPRTVSVGMLGFFFAANCIWPSYVALNLPGLPWINPQRFALFYLLALSLYGYATSSKMRNQTLEVVRTAKPIWLAFGGFWICTLIALPFSGSFLSFAFNKWINNQIYWSFIFLITAFLLRRQGGFYTVAKALMIAAIVTSLISIPEFIWRRVPWIGYVPDILIGDPVIYARATSSQARLDLDQYRARSSFMVSLSFAEFLSLALPFFLYALSEARTFVSRVLLAAAILLVAMAMAILTNARSGMNGLIIGIFGFVAIWAYRRWRVSQHDLVAPALVMGFPVAIAAFGVLVLAWQRLRVMVLGGGAHQFSNDAREVQWGIAIDRLMSNPIGHGAGRAAEVVGYANRGGELTIDSYYINLLIDNGVLGFLFFFGLAAAAVITGLRLYFTSDDPEVRLAGPAAVAIIAFMVIKSVLSQSENMTLFFALCGAICAAAWRHRTAPAAQTRAAARPAVFKQLASAAS